MMAKSITPGRLALWGLAGIAGGLVCGLLIFLLHDAEWADSVVTPLMGIAQMLSYMVAALLLVAAFVSKIVQIGVRSARDD